jgi:Skp family chaperone for outer membrane proteins
MHGCWKIATALPLAALLVGSAEASAPKVAVFNFERVDTSLDGAMYGPWPNQQQRLGRSGNQLRDRLAKSGRG